MMSHATVRKFVLVALAAALVAGAGLAARHELGHADARPAAAALEPEPQRRPAAEGPEDAAKKDLKLLEGEWKVSSMEIGGTAVPPKELTRAKYTFAGNKLAWDAPTGIMSKGGKEITVINDVRTGTVTIDPGKKPKQIDITHLSKKGGDRKLLGIYEVSGDTLKICWSSSGRRPAEFSSKDDPRGGNMVLKRAAK